MFLSTPKLVRIASLQTIKSKHLSKNYTGPQSPIHHALTSFSVDEDLLRQTVARFSKERIWPRVRQMDENATMDPDLIQGCFENGMMGIEVKSEWGGAGMSFVSSIIVVEELAKVDPSVSVCVDVQNTLIITSIRHWGHSLLQEKYLPLLATKVLGSFCLSEWTSGSDAFALKTTAKRDGDYYVINGTKAWITNSAEAGIFIVFANTDFSKGYKGITAFIVERDTPGLTVGKKEQKLGIRASSTCEVIFDHVRVPVENVLGEVGRGYKIAIEVLNEGRIGIGAQMVGLAQGAFDSTIPYIHQRQQFGKTISSFQGVQFTVADIATEIEAARLMVYNAARLKEEGKPFTIEAAQAKYFSSLVAAKVSSTCINLCGGVGFTKDMGIEKFYRDAKIGEIYEGTSNICRETISKLLLSKYKQ